MKLLKNLLVSGALLLGFNTGLNSYKENIAVADGEPPKFFIENVRKPLRLEDIIELPDDKSYIEISPTKSNRKTNKMIIPKWDLFNGNITFNLPPNYVGNKNTSLDFFINKPRKSGLANKIEDTVRKKIHKEIRKFVKREWRLNFNEDPSMRYDEFQEGLLHIGQIGRGEYSVQDYDMEKVKQDLFSDSYKSGEGSIELAVIGPFTLTDNGLNYRPNRDPLNIDFGSIEKKEKLKSLLFSKRVIFDYDINFSIDEKPPFFNRYGVKLEIDFLSSVLGKEIFSLETELEIKNNETLGFYIGLVIESR